jgi:hypothetical protein
MPKISELTSAATIAGTETIPVVQSATTKKVTAESLNRKPVFEISLEASNYTITQYGIYYVTFGTRVIGDRWQIILPNPSANAGMELLIINFDTTLAASFGGSYIPIVEGDITTGKIDVKKIESTLLVAINGVWSANDYKI